MKNPFLIFLILTFCSCVNQSTQQEPDTISAQLSPNSANAKDDISSHIQNHTFNLNGNGSVYFQPTAFSPNEGTIMISGEGSTLQGEYTIITPSSLRIERLQVTSGEYDASNNNGSRGHFYLKPDGTLTGTLTGGTATRSYTLYPNN